MVPMIEGRDNAVIDAMALMDNTDTFNIIHQTGINDESFIQKKYCDLNIKALVKAFFHNMPQLLDMADLAITSAGAGTISELCIIGLPAILVPFPQAADDHQWIAQFMGHAVGNLANCRHGIKV